MSINRLMLLQQASAPASEPEAPDWLLQMLREVMTAVAREEGDTLKKAAMIARLGALYLRASGARELKRAHRELARRCAHLEEQLAARQATGEATASPPPASERKQGIQPSGGAAPPPGSMAATLGTNTAPADVQPAAPSGLVVGPAAGPARASPAL